MSKIIIAIVAGGLIYFMGYVSGLYWHIKTAHRILNEGLK